MIPDLTLNCTPYDVILVACTDDVEIHAAKQQSVVVRAIEGTKTDAPTLAMGAGGYTRDLSVARRRERHKVRLMAAKFAGDEHGLISDLVRCIGDRWQCFLIASESALEGKCECATSLTGQS